MEPHDPHYVIEIRITDLKPFPARHLVQDAGFIIFLVVTNYFMHSYKYTFTVSSPHV